MKTIFALLFCCLLSLNGIYAHAARDVHAELEQLKQQRMLVQQAQKHLAAALGEVGIELKRLDSNLLKARKAYQDIRQQIDSVDEHLARLASEKKKHQANIHKLQQQMMKEAAMAYQHANSPSVWVDILSNVSITEIPHRQFLLKNIMLSQEQDRVLWREAMAALSLVEEEEQRNREKLLVLQSERQAAEQELVSQISAKRDAAKQLRSDLAHKKEQEQRLIRQEMALQQLLNSLDGTLLASDKKSKAASIRQQKGKLPLPLQGRIIIGYGEETANGVKLTGVHIAPKKRTEKGKSVHAMGQGQVRFADWFGGYGLMMIVDYGHGIMAVYAHNDILHKHLGDWVEKDETLAEAGSTGWIEDTRLYFEIRDHGKPVNPAHWCKK